MHPLQVGVAAPAFSLPLADGGTVRFEDFRGRKLVIFFYPKADTQACTREAIEFSAAKADFAAAGTELLGISHDPVRKQQKFVAKHGLTTAIASDESLDMLNAYGVWGEKQYRGRTYLGVKRWTFVIDEDGNVKRVFPDVKPAEHADNVLAALRA